MRWSGLAVLAVVAGTAPVGAEPRAPVLPDGAVDLFLAVETDLSKRRSFDVISAAPDVRVGISDRLTVSLTHSMAARSVIDSGGGLCSGCDSAYRNVFADLAYNVYDPARAPVAARLQIGAATIDPLEMSLLLGATGRYGGQRLWLQLEPSFQIGLNRRAEGNESQLDLPIWIAFSTWRITWFARTGIGGPTLSLSDEHRIPLGSGVMISISDSFEAGAEIGLPRLLGPVNSERFRHGSVWVRARL